MFCHSDPAVAGEESLIVSGLIDKANNPRCFALLNMTDYKPFNPSAF
jgi:hypothetical protein